MSERPGADESGDRTHTPSAELRQDPSLDDGSVPADADIRPLDGSDEPEESTDEGTDGVAR